MPQIEPILQNYRLLYKYTHIYFWKWSNKQKIAYNQNWCHINFAPVEDR